MINNIKNEKGITLITLVITMILLVIITSALARNSHSSLQLSNLTKMQNDIEILNDRIAAYYVKNNKLPVNGQTMTKNEVKALVDEVSSYDEGNYYVIDIEKLDNTTLNYGHEYNLGQSATDKYVINETTHMVYYLKGITYEGAVYHTIGVESYNPDL